jgi:hypothetical protein
MDLLSAIIAKLQDSRTHLINSDITSAKLLINGSIEDLILFVVNLENVAVQTTDDTTP